MVAFRIQNFAMSYQMTETTPFCLEMLLVSILIYFYVRLSFSEA